MIITSEVTHRQFISINELRQRMQGSRIVKVGIPAGSTELDGTSTAQVAATNEFGDPSQHIPERSFLRSAIKENADKYIGMNRNNLRQVLEGHMSINNALGLLGQVAVGDVQRKIRSGPFKKLSDFTIEARRRRLNRQALDLNKPLIDTGQMIQSITYVID